MTNHPNPNSAAQAAERQTVLTDDEIRGEIHNAIGFGFEPGELQAVNATDLMKVAHALLSQVRAPVADERAAFDAWFLAHPMNRSHHKDTTQIDEAFMPYQAWQARAALASAPVADNTQALIDHDSWFSEYGQCLGSFYNNLTLYTRAAWVAASQKYAAPVASAPADERAALLALRTIAEYPTPGEGNMSAANMREIARAALSGRSISGKCPPPPSAPPSLPYREVESGVIKPHAALASAPVAGEPLVWRVSWPGGRRPTDWRDFATNPPPSEEYLARAGYTIQVAYAAPQASADAGITASGHVRNAALEEAAHVMEQTGKRIAASDIRALKQPQADKDGPWCCERGEAQGVQVCQECAEISAGYQASMRGDKDSGQQRAGDGFDVEAAAKTMAECMDYPWAHMPEKGREQMRLHAQSVIRAALSAPQAEQGERDGQD